VSHPPPALHVVAEAYRFSDGPPPWEWSLTPDDLFIHIPLSGDVTLAEVGAVVATVVHNGQLERGPTAREWLEAVVADAPFPVNGGVVASDGEREVGPSCCCSVSGWREWQRFARDGQSPWMGHDPTGWAEWVGDTARVWSEGGFIRTGSGFAVEFPRDRFTSELAGIERKLHGFLDRVEEWAGSLGYADPPAVRHAFAVSVLDEPKG
jgi:hypothetical protein